MAKIHIEIWNRRRMILATCILLWILAVPDIVPGLVVLWALVNYRKTTLRLCWRLLKAVLWVYWRLLYYCTGLFFWHFLYKVLVHPEEYAHQGQQQQQQQQPVAARVIQTWKYATAPFLQCIIVTFGQVLQAVRRQQHPSRHIRRFISAPALYRSRGHRQPRNYCNIEGCI